MKRTAALLTILALIFLSLPALTSSAAGSGTVWVWGGNGVGQLGDGTTTDRPTPVQVSGLTDMVSVAGGFYHSLALKSAGTVWAWGYNSGGQLGDGTTTQRNTPVQVSGLTGVVAIAGGNNYSLAVKGDGTVWAWGWNGYGQLGDGTTTDRYTPVQVSGLSGVVAVAGDGAHSLALKSDGTVWAWGLNWYGQLGDGTTTQRNTPVQVSGLTDVVSVAEGYYYSLALKSDGTVWTWGHNIWGQLGDGTRTDRWTPVQVSGLSGVVAIAGGDVHSLALKSDGTVWTWGGNWYGQLGDGTTTYQRNTPVQVSGLSGVVAIAGGDYHSLALKSDGTVWAWGLNWYGQLGDGTTTQRNTPVQVSGLTDVVAIAGGGFHCLAVKCLPPAIASISPASGNQGAAVTVNGTAFGPTQCSSYVSFGSVQATQYNQWSDTQITALVPANTSGVMPVTVTTPGGTSNAVNFSVVPYISSISPSRGSAGTTTTINGTAFSAAQGSSNVYFGTVAATSYTSWSDTQITAIVPAGLSGMVPVTVTTPGGMSNAVNFTMTMGGMGGLPPTITSIWPTYGNQGTLVTIKGTEFGGTRGSFKVYFGTVAATSYTLWSDRRIKARVPANTSGVVPVRVSTLWGYSNAVNFRVLKGMPFWVCVNDYTAPIYYKARGANVCNYIMQGPMSVHVNSVYVEINNNFVSNTRQFEEVGWWWNYENTDTTPCYFWAVCINGQVTWRPLGPAPAGKNTQLQIYMANPTNTPWRGGYLWNYLINNSLVAQIEGANSRGCAHVSSERNQNTSYQWWDAAKNKYVDISEPSNDAHFWAMYSMGSKLGSWQLWKHLEPWYKSLWDPAYTWKRTGTHDIYIEHATRGKGK